MQGVIKREHGALLYMHKDVQQDTVCMGEYIIIPAVILSWSRAKEGYVQIFTKMLIEFLWLNVFHITCYRKIIAR